MSEYIHYLTSSIETRNLTHIIRAVIDTNTSFLLFSFLLPFLYICSGEGPLKKRKGDKQRCLFYAKCNFFLVDGERLVCQRCSDAQGGQTSNGASFSPPYQSIKATWMLTQRCKHNLQFSISSRSGSQHDSPLTKPLQ